MYQRQQRQLQMHVPKKAIELISVHLKTAVHDGKNVAARDQMAYAEYLAGMAFNNASLGYVHAMAHQLGGMFDLPHGVCNAVLLPHVQMYNAHVVPERLTDVARFMGGNTTELSASEGAQLAIRLIKELSAQVDIPSGLAELGVDRTAFPALAENALKDACGFTNPKQATLEEIISIFESAY